MFGISLFSGLFATLTPLVFPSLLLYFFIFSKLSKSKKEHWINILLFSIINIVSLLVLSHFIVYYERSEAIAYISYFTVALEFLTIIFALWLSGFLIKMIDDEGIELTNKVFRYVGISLLSIKLAFASFSSTGPIIGSLFVAGNSGDITFSLIGFSFGVILPFLLVLGVIGAFVYQKKRDKKWMNIINVIIGSTSNYHWNL